MNDENTQTGGDKVADLINRIRVILFSFSKRTLSEKEVEKIDKSIDILKTPIVINPTFSLAKFKMELQKNKAKTRRLILVTAVISVLLMGAVAAIANKGWRLNRTIERNTIEYGTSIEWKEEKNIYITYSTLDEMLQDLNLPLPLLIDFPDKLQATNIVVDEINDYITIDIIYTDVNNNEKIRTSYKYFKEQTEIKGSTEINDTYIDLGNFELLGNTVNFFTDTQMRIAVWNYQNFILTVRTDYTKEQLQEIMQKIKIYEVRK